MFRLIKLSAYALLGYCLYELYQGLSEPRQTWRSRSPELSRALDEPRQRAIEPTIQRGSVAVTTEEASGASTPHTVGRGVG